MAQWSEEIRNLWISSTETAIDVSPTMKIFDGTMPDVPEDADSGTVLAELDLPSDWLTAPSAGEATKLGTWQDTTADASGTARYFRLYDSDGDCHLQGDIGLTDADMIVLSTTVVQGGSFVIASFLAHSIGGTGE